MKKIFSFLAAVLFAGSMMATTVTKTVADLATELSFTNSEVCTPFALDEVIAVSTEAADANTGKYYSNGEQIRLYQTGAAKLILTAADGYKISSVTLEYASQNTGILVEAASGEAVAFENVQSATFTVGNSGSATNGQARITSFSVTYAAAEGGETPVEPGDEPSVLQAVSDSTTWDFSKITANTENALYKKEGIQLTDESTPSKNDEVIYADYSADFMTIGEDFNKVAIAFKGEYPIRKNQYCQAGTLHFKADVAGTIVVKFSDTGTSASETAVKRYLVVNGEQTEYWTSRENNGTEAYDAQLNVVSEKIAVPAGDVTITGSSAIVVYYVTFVPEQAVEPEGPKNLGAKTIAEFLELKNTTDTCILTGVVSNIQNTTYGNFDLTDESGKVYVYGLLTPEGESKKFAELNVAENDTLTVLAIYNEHNGNPQAKNAIFVEVKKSSAPVVEPVNLGAKTIAEFLELKNTKDTCILTGVVSNIQNTTYGNFDLTDESGTVYVYGLLTPEGESKKFADLNVAEKDTLTVLAIYNEYNGNPQVKNAVFVEVKKAAVEPGETIELVFDNGGVDNYYYANYGSTDIQLYNIPVVGGELQGDGDFLQLEIYPADPNDISGEYSIEDEGLDDYYTYLMRVNGTDTTEIEFVAGSITVSVQNPDKENSSADLTVQGQLMTAEGDVYVINSTLNVYYNFTISEDEKYKFDEAEAEFNYNFDTYQILPTGSDVVVGVMAQTDEAMIAAMIVLPEGQTELVAGEYEVSVLPMYGTVMAGQYTADGPQPSYAMMSAGKLWYFVSGKVTVEGDGSIVIDALNSNGKAIKSTLNHLHGEGIDEVNAAVKATKTLKNGQLIIEIAGVKYNAQGAVIR